jgi:hypothetical protein
MPDTCDSIKILEYANETRKFEIGLFWQRSLFFWGFTTTAIIAYGAAYQTHIKNLQFSVACIGLICSIIWTLVNRSSAYWQRVWERKVEAIQYRAISYDLFSHRSNEAQQVKETWGWGPKHYSLTKLAIAFSDFVVLIWLGLLLFSSPVWPWLRSYPCLSGSWLPPILIIVITTICILAVLIFAKPDKLPQSN